VVCPLCDGGVSRPEREVAGFALERCAACGFVFMNPQYTAEEIAALYTDRDSDALTTVYSRIAASPAVKRDYAGKLDLLESLVPGRGRLLDFACGSGAFFEMAGERGWDAHGVEVGAWAAEAAAARGLRNMHIGELADLGFEPGSFDVVYAAQVFEHLPRPRRELQEIRRLLKPGGLLYVDVPNYHTLPIALGRDDFMLNEPPQHLNYYTPATLGRLLRSGGFDVVRVGSGGGLKWENLLRRPINSDIAKAYGLVPGGQSSPEAPGSANGAAAPPGPAPAAPPPPGWKAAVKRVAVQGLVKPLLYDRLKLGMVLYAAARRP
jgi:SAM-dependent methyltransferase